MHGKTVWDFIKDLVANSSENSVKNKIIRIYGDNNSFEFEGSILSFISDTKAGNIGLVELAKRRVNFYSKETGSIYVGLDAPKDSNKSLEIENTSSFFVIVADRDGVRKYLSRTFPKTFPYTVKMSRAQRFYSEAAAWNFIERFNKSERYTISNPEVREVQRIFKLI